MSVGKFRQRHKASGPLQASRHNLLLVRSKDGYLYRSQPVPDPLQENANEYEIDQRQYIDVGKTCNRMLDMFFYMTSDIKHPQFLIDKE